VCLGDRAGGQEDAHAVGVANQRDRDVTGRGHLRDATRRTAEAQVGQPLEGRLHVDELGEHEEPGRRVRRKGAGRDIAAADEGVELQHARRHIGHTRVAEKDRTQPSARTIKKGRPVALNLPF